LLTRIADELDGRPRQRHRDVRLDPHDRHARQRQQPVTFGAEASAEKSSGGNAGRDEQRLRREDAHSAPEQSVKRSASQPLSRSALRRAARFISHFVSQFVA
jgi:hypothetical protein